MNKRLVIMFSAIAAVIVIVVVCCVLFMVGSVGVETVIGLELTDEQEAGVIAVSGISKGQSVFSVDESASASAIEKAYPTLAVVTIERIFPNKVDIKIASRTGVVAVAIEDADYYAVVDRDLGKDLLAGVSLEPRLDLDETHGTQTGVRVDGDDVDLTKTRAPVLPQHLPTPGEKAPLGDGLPSPPELVGVNAPSLVHPRRIDRNLKTDLAHRSSLRSGEQRFAGRAYGWCVDARHTGDTRVTRGWHASQDVSSDAPSHASPRRHACGTSQNRRGCSTKFPQNDER